FAVVGLHKFFSSFGKEDEKKKALLWASGIVGGITLIVILFGSTLFDFASPYDSYFGDELGFQFVDAIREDRLTLFRSDAIRSFIFVVLATAILWFFMKGKLKKGFAIATLSLLVVFDLVGVDRRYVDDKDFKENGVPQWITGRDAKNPFPKTGADIQILEDDGHFRVYDATTNAFNSGRASYFHNALGGYHAAKPGRMQDLYEFYISKGNIGVL